MVTGRTGGSGRSRQKRKKQKSRKQRKDKRANINKSVSERCMSMHAYDDSIVFLSLTLSQLSHTFQLRNMLSFKHGKPTFHGVFVDVVRCIDLSVC